MADSLDVCHLRYSYALVLGRPSAAEGGEADPTIMHTKILEMLLRAGLDVALLRNEPAEGEAEGAAPLVVVLSAERPLNGDYAPGGKEADHGDDDDDDDDDGEELRWAARTPAAATTPQARARLAASLQSAAPPLLQAEHDRLYSERFIKVMTTGTAHQPPKLSAGSLTAAKKLLLTRRIVHRALDVLSAMLDKEARGSAGGKVGHVGVSGSKGAAWRFVKACFPLHDERWNNLFLRRYLRTAFSRTAWLGALASDITTTRERKRALLHLGVDEATAERTLEAGSTSFYRLDKLVKRAGGSQHLALEDVADAEPAPASADAKDAPDGTDDGAAAAKGQRGSGAPRAGGGAALGDAQPDDWAIQALRAQLGERAAFYFAFNAFYTSWLLPLVVVMVCYYLIFRIAHWPSYARGLSVLGWCVPTVWAPLLMIYWRRREQALGYVWGVRGVPADESPNPDAKYRVMLKDRRTGETERRFDPNNNRRTVAWLMFPVIVINLAIIVVGIGPFTQWYAFGRMAPLCSCCEWHQAQGAAVANVSSSGQLHFFAGPPQPPLPAECDYLVPQIYTQAAPASCAFMWNCFTSRASTVGTDRWLYILFQGIILGIFLDVVQFEAFVALTTALTRAEHWPTVADFESRLVRKQFLFCWVNMYFWFLAVAFAYVPFGEGIQQLLIDNGMGGFVPEYGWQDGSLNIDEAFVTPLVVTQSINLLLETLVPFCCMRAARKLPPIRSLDLPGLDTLKSKRFRKGSRSGSSAGGATRSRGGSGASDAKAGARDPALPQPARDGAAAPAGPGVQAVEPRTPTVDELEAEVSSALREKEYEGEAEAKGEPGDGAADAAADGPAPPGVVPSVPPQPRAPALPVVDESRVSTASTAAPTSPEKKHGGVATEVVVAVEDAGGGLMHDSDYDDPDVPGLPVEVLHAHRCYRSLGLKLRVLAQTEDGNRLDAAEVLHQAGRATFNPRADYLDLLMQFGYVVMFTTAWALAPVPALLNNVLEIRTDAFKVLRNLRRPDPSEDTGIGEWSSALRQSTLLSLPVVAGLIVMSTGQLEWWLFDDSCHPEWAEAEEAKMAPDLSCFSTFGWRLLWGVIIERIGVSIVAFLTRAIPDASPSLRAEIADGETARRRKMQDTLLPELPAGLEADLRVVFEKFDKDKSGSLNAEELQDLFLVLLGYTLPPHHMAMVLSFVDVDGSNTATFAEFALALQRSQDDFVLSQVLRLKNLAHAARDLAQDIRDGKVDSLAAAKVAAGFVDEDGDGVDDRAVRSPSMMSPVRRAAEGEYDDAGSGTGTPARTATTDPSVGRGWMDY